MQRICRKGAVQTSGRAKRNADIEADFFGFIPGKDLLLRLGDLHCQFRLMLHHKVILCQKTHTFIVRLVFFQHDADQFRRAYPCQQTPLRTDASFFHQKFVNRTLDDTFLFFIPQSRFVILHGPFRNFLSTAIKHCRSNAFFHFAFYSDFRICHFLCTSIVTVCKENLNHCLHIILQFVSTEDIINHICIHKHQNSFSLSNSSVTGPSFTSATFISAWNTPVATFLIPSVCAFAHSLSNSSVAISGAAPPL